MSIFGQGGLQLVQDIISSKCLFEAKNLIPPPFAVTTKCSNCFSEKVLGYHPLFAVISRGSNCFFKKTEGPLPHLGLPFFETCFFSNFSEFYRTKRLEI